MKFYQQIEKQLNKLLGKVECTCNDPTWVEDWDWTNENNKICTDCFVRENLIKLCHRVVTGKVQGKTITKTLVRIHSMMVEGPDELDNIKLLQFVTKLEEYQKKAKEEKEKKKLQNQYKKFVNHKKAKRRKGWIKLYKAYTNMLDNMSPGGTI